MVSIKKIVYHKESYCFLILLVIAFIGFGLQSLILLNSDVASLLSDTKLFLSGGTYINDFFETNPPMIFIIYSPAVLLSEWFSWDITICIRLYVILLSLLSLVACNSIAKKIIEEKHDSFRYALIYLLAVLLLIKSTDDFGQREHILMLFMMPYLFGVVAWAEHKKIPIIFACCIGFFAGLGFGLKPYFLPALILVEFYLIFHKRQFLGWVRLESLICGFVLVGYLIFVFLFHENYFKILYPLISHFYFVSVQKPWDIVFMHPGFLFCLIPLVYFLIFYYKKTFYPILTRVLVFALIGMILAFLIPRAPWRYHVLPAIFLSCLLIMIYLYEAFFDEVKNYAFSKKEMVLLLITGFILPICFFCKEMVTAISANHTLSKQLFVKQFQNLADRSVYCFSAGTTGVCFPLVYQVKKEFTGRFPFFWWLRGLIAIEKSSFEGLSEVLKKDKKFLIESVAADLDRYQPDIVLIDSTEEKVMSPEEFSFVAYLSENQAFREAWQSYRYWQSLGNYRIYKRVS